MSSQYELGGILKAIHGGEKKLKERKAKENDALLQLFLPKSNTKEEDDDGELQYEQIKRINSFIDNDAYSDTEMKGVASIQTKAKSGFIANLAEQTKTAKRKKQKEEPERIARTLFVGNVAFTVTKKMLKKIFLQFGEIESIRIRSVPTADPKLPKKVALIQKTFHSERNNMNAYIVYKDKNSTDKATICNGTLLEGLHLRVDKSDNKKHDHKRCIFVGNLPFNAAEEDLRNHFKQCGEIDDIRLIRDKATSMGKGFGYIRFQSSDGVMFGLKLNGSTFNDRPLRVYQSREQHKNQVVRSVEKNSYTGLRSTSKKDREKGKKIFGQGKPRKSDNALQRMQNKQRKQTQLKHSRNKEKNMKKKGHANKKEKKASKK